MSAKEPRHPRVPKAQRRRCFVCEGQPWRRPLTGCGRCREPYGPEPTLELVRDAIRKAVA